MKRIYYFMLVFMFCFINSINAQNESGLLKLEELSSTYKDFKIGTIKQIPLNMDIIIKCNLVQYTKVIDGYVGDVNLTDKEVLDVSNLLTTTVIARLNIKQNTSSEYKFIVNISSSAPYTTFDKNGKQKSGIIGSIFFINNKEKLLYHYEGLNILGDELNPTIKNFASFGVNKLILSTQNDNDALLIKKVKDGSNEDLKNFLATNKPNINAISGEDGWNALLIASSKGDLDKVITLIENGAKVDATLYDGRSVLYIAASNGYLNIVKLLTEKGCILDSKNDEGRSPLRIAAYDGSLEIVKVLIIKGANVNIKDNDGNTGLICAALNNDTSMLKLFIDNKANINLQTNDGFSALMISSYKNDIVSAKLLLSKGANVNLKNTKGATALIFAVNYGFTEMVKLLLSHGAAVNEKTNEGRSALMVAKEKKYGAIVEILKNNGALEPVEK